MNSEYISFWWAWLGIAISSFIIWGVILLVIMWKIKEEITNLGLK